MKRRVYTVGKMSGIDLATSINWRMNFENEVQCRSGAFVFCHPPFFYNYEHDNYQSESEVKEWELAHVLESDILVVDLNGINQSVGSHFEIATANAVNMFGNKHIYIIGVGKTDGLHPWIKDSLFRVERNWEAAAEYITSYLE